MPNVQTDAPDDTVRNAIAEMDPELQQFMNDMAAAVPLMQVTERRRELIKAGMRACMRHAIMEHTKRVNLKGAKG